MFVTRSTTRSTVLMVGLAALCVLVDCGGNPELISPGVAGAAGSTEAGADTQQDAPLIEAAADAWLLDSEPQDAELADGCAAQTSQVELLPLDVYVMLDQSGSMLGGKWSAVTSALGGFVAANASTELLMALQYFPLPAGDVCKWQAYGVPEVAMAPLADNASAISSSLSKHTSPTGETPTLPAVQGAYDYARTWAKDHPTHTTVVLLATDGEPNVCGSTVANVSQAAKLAWEQAGIRTFVIGVGQSLTSLQSIAQSGGSDQAFLVDDGGASTEQQFRTALEQIRGKALTCEYEIPKPAAGTIDVNRVNVIHTPSAGEARWLLHLDGADACTEAPDGWYYDDSGNPKRVILCPAACDMIKSDAKGRVDVVFGCKTKIA